MHLVHSVCVQKNERFRFLDRFVVDLLLKYLLISIFILQKSVVSQ